MQPYAWCQVVYTAALATRRPSYLHTLAWPHISPCTYFLLEPNQLGLQVMQRATGFTMGIDLAGATKQAARRAPSYLHPSVRALQEGSYESSMPRVGSPPYRLAGHSSGTEALDKSLADKTSMDELRKQVGELLNDTD